MLLYLCRGREAALSVEAVMALKKLKQKPRVVKTAWSFATVIRGEHSGKIAVGETYTQIVRKFENEEWLLGVKAANGALLYVPEIFFDVEIKS